jgi:hypothetical protein
MKTFEIILKGGLRSCCSTYSAEDMKEFTKHWFKDQPEVRFDIIDIEEDFYETGTLADLAYKHFGNAIFPMIYLNNQLISIDHFPERYECKDIIKNPVSLTREVIEDEARKLADQKKTN